MPFQKKLCEMYDLISLFSIILIGLIFSVLLTFSQTYLQGSLWCCVSNQDHHFELNLYQTSLKTPLTLCSRKWQEWIAVGLIR